MREMGLDREGSERKLSARIGGFGWREGCCCGGWCEYVGGWMRGMGGGEEER